MIPPGLAGFPERERTLAAGPTTIKGRAWSGWAEIERVELAVDGEWARCRARPAGRDAGPGAAGAPSGTRHPASTSSPAAPTTPPATRSLTSADWNVGGYANNGVQLVPVTVT